MASPAFQAARRTASLKSWEGEGPTQGFLLILHQSFMYPEGQVLGKKKHSTVDPSVERSWFRTDAERMAAAEKAVFLCTATQCSKGLGM